VCDNTYMSVATRIWIQEIIKIFIFPGAGGLISSPCPIGKLREDGQSEFPSSETLVHASLAREVHCRRSTLRRAGG
jgi:hypothetical protein